MGQRIAGLFTRQIRRSILAALVLSAAFGASGARAGTHLVQHAQVPVPVRFDGISFRYGSSMANTVTAKIFSRLQAAPTPPGAVFSFPGYIGPFNNAILNVYAVQALNQDRFFRHDIPLLRSMLRTQPSLAYVTHVPYILFSEGRMFFQTRFRYVHFANGSGIAFLTTYGLGPVILTNHYYPLKWVFEGLTNDGRYAVTATFPVRDPGLPNTENPAAHVPNPYAAYLRHVSNQANRLSQDAFVPYLNNLVLLAESLDLHPRNLPTYWK